LTATEIKTKKSFTLDGLKPIDQPHVPTLKDSNSRLIRVIR
jgi:hypothetical protein